MNAPPPTAPVLPPRPRLVLRVGFAGRRELSPDEATRLDEGLHAVLQTLGHRLAAISPGVPVGVGNEPKVSAFFARKCPLMRLVTGLCEGADALAAEVLNRVSIAPDSAGVSAPHARCLETELAAVIPFDVENYRRSRATTAHADFDRQLARCAWVVALDGVYEKPDPDIAVAKHRRARAYRAQSAFLLRHSDLLIAAADPDDPGGAGGTLETVREALAFELPVIFVHTGTGAVHLVEPEEDLLSNLAAPAPSAETWQATIRQWVTQLTADPDAGLDPGEGGQGPSKAHGEPLLTEFFDTAANPPHDPHNQERKKSIREKVWVLFEKLFQSGKGPEGDIPLEPYAVYRRRATDLNRHYTGLYRGAFLLNYGLAIAAVTLAAVSLVLLGTVAHTGPVQEIAAAAEAAGQQAAHSTVAPIPSPWLLKILLVLAAVKVLFLSFISHNTRRANREEWNDRAVDYRYLAERLRGMFYLPLIGSHQPPTAAPPQFASRVVRQSAVDWLFEALVRAVSPAEMPDAKPAEFPDYTGRGVVHVKALLPCDPLNTTKRVRDRWIAEQTKYHERNARTMHALYRATEGTGEVLSRAVILIVAIDLLIVVGELLRLLPAAWSPRARAATPWLIFVSAILPAVVAALNGVRFQSECQRLAERSAVMRVMLHGRANAAPGESQGRWQLADELARRIESAQSMPVTNPGSWSHDALRLTERVATDFVQEAAEWSVLYAKEVSDPG